MLIKREYIDKETAITAENMNDIQDAVIALEDGLFSVDNDKSGVVIGITDASTRGFRSLNVYGKTTQDGTPTPDAPVDLMSAGGGGPLVVNVCGANMANYDAALGQIGGTVIDGDGFIISTNNSTETKYINLPIIAPYGVITISIDIASETDVYVQKHREDYDVHHADSFTHTANADGWLRVMWVVRPGETSKVRVMAVRGSSAMPYEPLKKQTLTINTPNGLPGIPVASGGNYTDANGQQWICDEIDLARGVYVQRVYRKKFTNTDGIQRIESGIGYRFAYAVPGLIPSNTTSGAYSLCNSLALVQQGETYAMPNSYTVTSTDILMALNGSETLNDLANYLAEKPIEVQCVLVTPIETTLSEEELAAYAALHTYKDHTTVSNDSGAWMDLEYVMDAKKYIDHLVISGGASARLANVTLSASKWVGADSLYSQVVTIDGITEYSKVDLLPSVEQLAIFHNKDVAFVTENEDGVVTVYAIGDKPLLDYTMQVSITEVVA